MDQIVRNIGNENRLRLKIEGVVQGVGFRPFVYITAKKLHLSGTVCNGGGGVIIEIEGEVKNLIEFQRILRLKKPPLSHITNIESQEIELRFSDDFHITHSDNQKDQNTLVSPDVSVCKDCLRELFDANNRRFRYPFINCTNCGTRFTIIRNIPYDRPNTTMDVFKMCRKCRKEYENPLDRRFHAEPNACDKCGPKIWFVGNSGKQIDGKDAILMTQKSLIKGEIVAVKGIGGFHLACDARSDTALEILRARKGRVDKPFAVMCKDSATAKNLVEIGEMEKILLESKERPIVLLRKRKDSKISELVAPRNPFLGVMLPYSPLHYLMFNPVDENLPMPDVLVMTSGNFSSEPIVKDNSEALEKLANLADAFLLHDREIFVPCDDSVIRIVESSKFEVQSSKNSSFILHPSSFILPLRRSRGYAPFPVKLPFNLPPVLAVGGELKATFCVARDEFAFMSQHIGDMENLETLRAFEKSVAQMQRLFRIEPEIVAFDKHPNYLSSRWAKDNSAKLFHSQTKLVAVQHHHAHIASVLAENGFDGSEKVIGFAFDGTGYGNDGAIWGGEVLLADYQEFERAAHLKYFPLAGGDVSVKKPYRLALAQLWQAGIEWNENLPCVAACAETEKKILLKQFENDFNIAPTSSFGRLFDAVASIAGIRQTITYEAQGAIEFEALINEIISDAYEFNLIDVKPIQIDSANLIAEVVKDVLAQTSASIISAKFNNAVADLILRLALKFRKTENLNQVALSGGCFQNVALLRASLRRLEENDFEVFTHRQVPPNDGGLALGQSVIAGFENSQRLK